MNPDHTDPRRVLYLDVDGTINVDHHEVPISLYFTHSDGMTRMSVFDEPIIDGIRELISDGVTVVWNTTWNRLAVDELAPALRLPVGMPHVHHESRFHGTRFGWSSKLMPVWNDVNRRDLHGARVVILDDMVGGKDEIRAEEFGFFVPRLDPFRGVTREMLNEVRAYFT